MPWCWTCIYLRKNYSTTDYCQMDLSMKQEFCKRSHWVFLLIYIFYVVKDRLSLKSNLSSQVVKCFPCHCILDPKTLKILLLLGRRAILRREGSSFLSLTLADPAVIASDWTVIVFFPLEEKKRSLQGLRSCQRTMEPVSCRSLRGSGRGGESGLINPQLLTS